LKQPDKQEVEKDQKPDGEQGGTEDPEEPKRFLGEFHQEEYRKNIQHPTGVRTQE